MNKNLKNQYNNARKSGLSNTDIAKMKEIAKKSAMQMEKDAVDKAFFYMLAIPLNVLANDYWSKTAKKKMPQFIKDVISLYDSVQEGVVSSEELASLLDDLAGVKVEADWLNKK